MEPIPDKAGANLPKLRRLFESGLEELRGMHSPASTFNTVLKITENERDAELALAQRGFGDVASVNNHYNVQLYQHNAQREQVIRKQKEVDKNIQECIRSARKALRKIEAKLVAVPSPSANANIGQHRGQGNETAGTSSSQVPGGTQDTAINIEDMSLPEQDSGIAPEDIDAELYDPDPAHGRATQVSAPPRQSAEHLSATAADEQPKDKGKRAKGPFSQHGRSVRFRVDEPDAAGHPSPDVGDAEGSGDN